MASTARVAMIQPIHQWKTRSDWWTKATWPHRLSTSRSLQRAALVHPGKCVSTSIDLRVARIRAETLEKYGS